jgi:hypothetical protein
MGLATVLSLSLAGPAHAHPTGRASQSPPAELVGPAGPDSGGPPACRPSRRRLCGDGDLAPSTAAKRLLATLARSGRGTRSASALAGRDAARRADRRLAAALGRPSGGAAQSAPVVRDSVEQRTSVRRGRGGERRRFAWRASVERCPDPGPPANSHGRAALRAGAILEVVNDEPRRDVIVRTITRMETRIETSIASDNRANLDFVGQLGKRNDITVTQSVLVIRQGKARRLGGATRLEMSAELLAPDLGVLLPAEGFDAFVERMEAQERGEPSPGADGPIVGQAWRNAVRDFMQLVAARANALARQAETHWRTPNRCLGLTLEGPGRGRPGQRLELTGRPTPGERGGTARSLLGDGRGSGTWTSARAPRGKRVESLVSRLPLPEDKPWIAFTLPDSRWPKGSEPSVEMTLASKAGVATATKIVEEGLPERFSGTVRVTVTRQFITTTFTSEIAFGLVTDTSLPDGRRAARYELRSGTLTSFDDVSTAPCRPRAVTSGPAIVRFGDLELDIDPQGRASYAFVQDLGRENVTFVPQELGLGCQATVGLAVAFFNARTAAGGLRPAPDSLRLEQGTTSDAVEFTGGATGEASWTLLPE